MKGFDVLKVKSAVKAHNKFDLSRSHLTTMDFGQIVPLFVEETVPGDKLSVSASYFSRMAPLVKPTYGKFQFKTVAGFVPYHQIAEDAEAWLAGKTTFEGQTPHQRHLTLWNLHQFIVGYCVDGQASPGASDCDYSYVDGSGTTTYVQFTPQGKYYVKILNSLGYALPQGVDMQTTSTWYTTQRLTKISAYPLLAFVKLYNDYMSQSQRYNSSVVSDLLHRIKHGLAYSGMWTSTTGEIATGGIAGMLANIFLNYENDYFTSAWQMPNSAINSLESVASTSIPVGNSNSFPTQVQSSVNDNYITLGSSRHLPQRALDFLKSFDDWVRRNNYSGSRSVQQVYSRFGIKSDDYRSNYAHVVKTESLPIQVGDVTATADSTNVPLGDYAGKGIMSGTDGISYEANDFGLFMILGYFTVTPMNAYGFDRRVLRNTPLDYYNPEFDGLGAEAISLAEVYENPLGVAESDTSSSDSVFGFTERYNAYRYGRDVITGEFRNYRNYADMNTWHTGRNLGQLRKTNNLVAQSSSVNTMESTDSQYNRIFSVTSGIVDHFYLTCKFDVSAIRPMLNLNQVPRLGEGDTVVPRNGNVIS